MSSGQGSDTKRDINLLMSSRVRATPNLCTRAVVDELEGRSHWWSPYVQVRHRPGTPRGVPGCVVDAIAHPLGHAERVLGTTHWGLRLTALEPGVRAGWSFIDGQYRGWMEWTFTDDGAEATRVCVRGHVSPRGWNRLRALLWDEVFEITRLLRRGFDGMSRHLAEGASHELPDRRVTH